MLWDAVFCCVNRSSTCIVAKVLARLSMNPDPNARHELFLTRDREAALVAVMNIVFAFGAHCVLTGSRDSRQAKHAMTIFKGNGSP